MSRNFPDFIESYVDYVKDGFAPDKFHTWMALSVIAGALQRKVKITQSESVVFYPNLYVMIVAKPGIGKSSAIKPGVKLLEALETGGQKVNVLPAQMTEAKFISLMSQTQSYEVGSKVYYQSAGYFAASEASNSLKNVYGDFLNCLTDFYDCPDTWRRSTMKHSDENSSITNACLNVVAGCTFDYLAKLISTESIQGGFASRFIYVIQKDSLVRKAEWGGGVTKRSTETKVKLVEDLTRIGKMQGEFNVTDEFIEAWNSWFPAYDAYRQSHPNESMQSLLTRKSTNLLKLCMLFSAAENSDMLIEMRHWERAMGILDAMEEDLPAMMTRAYASNTDTQLGMNAAIKTIFAGDKVLKLPYVFRQLTYKYNFKPQEVKVTLDHYMNNHVLNLNSANELRLIGDEERKVLGVDLTNKDKLTEPNQDGL